MVVPFRRSASSPSPKPNSYGSVASLAPLSPLQCNVLKLVDRLQVLALRDPAGAVVIIGLIDGLSDEITEYRDS